MANERLTLDRLPDQAGCQDHDDKRDEDSWVAIRDGKEPDEATNYQGLARVIDRPPDYQHAKRDRQHHHRQLQQRECNARDEQPADRLHAPSPA